MALSRFCNIYIPYPSTDNVSTSLHQYKKKHIIDNLFIKKRKTWLEKNIVKKLNYQSIEKCCDFVDKLYEKAYSGLDIIKYIENNKNEDDKNKYLYLIYFDKIRSEYRNEKLYMLTILNLYFMRKNLKVENILEM